MSRDVVDVDKLLRGSVRLANDEYETKSIEIHCVR